MLRYTGHPFVDVGVATLTALAGKRAPEELTSEDLEHVAAFIEDAYVKPPLRGYLTMAFTSNAWFVQDAYNPDKPDLSAEQRKTRLELRNDWAARHLRQWQATDEADDETCVFTGLPAVGVNLSGKLPFSRAGRAQIPLLQGDDAINFFADGYPGLPVSGLALLALQLFPLGCAKCGVGLLAVHSDNNTLTYRIARRFWQQTQKAVAQAQAAGETKLGGSSRSVRTLLVETLVEVQQDAERAGEKGEMSSITAYNFNNGKTADLRLYFLPLEIVSFLRVVSTPVYKNHWELLVRRSWQKILPLKGKVQADQLEPRHNYLYEDLFTLPDQSSRFIRTYFLQIPQRSRAEDDPRGGYTVRDELDLVPWPLVELFLRKVVRMDEQRLAQIRTLGDGLASYVRRQGSKGKRFFRAFFTENNASNFRARLIRANLDHIKDGQPPLFDLDSYVDVFEEGYEIMRPDWRLARDLVLIRMIDQLKEWLAHNPDATPEAESEAESEGDELVGPMA